GGWLEGGGGGRGPWSPLRRAGYGQGGADALVHALVRNRSSSGALPVQQPPVGTSSALGIATYASSAAASTTARAPSGKSATSRRGTSGPVAHLRLRRSRTDQPPPTNTSAGLVVWSRRNRSGRWPAGPVLPSPIRVTP